MMKAGCRKLSLVLFLALMANAGTIFATDKAPDVSGQFGFDWLQPAKAKCAAITPEAAKLFKSCEYSGEGGTGSFTGKADYTKCTAGKKSEFMIYKTQARCREELETMKANGD